MPSSTRWRWIGLLVLAACSTRVQREPSQFAGTLTPSPDAEFRFRAPASVVGALLRPPSVQTTTLANGFTVSTAERSDLPFVALVLTNRAARDVDSSEFGIAALTAEILAAASVARDGTVERPPSLEGDRPSLTINPRGYFFQTQVDTLGLADGVGLLARIVQRPVFDAESLRSARRALEKRFFLQGTRVRDWLRRMARQSLYPNDPVVAVSRNEQTVKLADFSLQQARRFYDSTHDPAQMALIAVGDVKASEVSCLAQEQFGGWTAGHADPTSSKPSAPPEQRTGKREVLGLHQPQEQARFVLAFPCTGSADPDNLAFDVLAALLGSISRSRIAQTLRHETGSAFQVAATCFERETSGDFLIEFDTNSTQAADSVERVFEAIRRLKASGIDARDLDSAKMEVLASLAERFATNKGFAGHLTQSFMRRHGRDYATSIEARVRTVTPDDLKRLATRYLDETRAGISVAGDSQVLHPLLSGLGVVSWHVP